MPRPKFATTDEYINSFPNETQEVLQSLRKLIKHVLPAETEEAISYQIPTFKLQGRYVVYFAGFKKHVSIFPMSDSIQNALPKIASYRTGKGTLQFPLDKKLPLSLIEKVVRLLVQEHLNRHNKS